MSRILSSTAFLNPTRISSDRSAKAVSLRGEQEVLLQGVGGKADGILTVVEFTLGKHRWTAPVIFTDAVGKRGILGQLGFFAFFTVTFRYRQHTIDIQRRTRN